MVRRSRLLVGAAGLVVIAAAGFYGFQALQRNAARNEALELASLGEYEKAVPLLRQVVSWYPEDPAPARALALAHMLPGMPVGSSEPHLSHWCDIAPDDPEAFRARMRMWTALGRREDALQDGLEALRLDPHDLELRATVAAQLVFSGRATEAEEELRRGLESRPDDPELQFLLAENLRLQGRTKAASEALDTILRDHPDHSGSLLRKAELLNTQGGEKDHAEAIVLLRRILANESARSEHRAARYQLSHALGKTGHEEEAARLLRENRNVENAEHLLRDSRQQWDNLDLGLRAARALLDIGRPREAVELLGELANRHRPDSRLIRLLSECRMRLASGTG